MLNYNEIEKNINYVFKNKSLLETALTHTSYSNETGAQSYQRLEFLGDSVLGFITAQNLFNLYQDWDEGRLTKMRAALVCETALAKLFINLNLPAHIRLGVGEDMNNGRSKESILSDCFESILAAIFLDGGYEKAKIWLDQVMPPERYVDFEQRDWKSLLYEQYPNHEIEYKIHDFGPDRRERFSVQVLLDGKIVGEGLGTTKKSAVQAASKNAL